MESSTTHQTTAEAFEKGQAARQSWGRRLAKALAVGLFAGAVAGAGAYYLVNDAYESVGYIKIKPYVSPILFQTAQTGAMPMFDAFVETQVTDLQGQRAIAYAMDSVEWRAAVSKSSPRTRSLAEFTDGLDVSHPRNSEVIRVAFSDRDPKVAQASVKALIDVYTTKISPENESDSVTVRLQKLEDRREQIAAQIKGLNDRIQTIATQYSTDDLDGRFNHIEGQFERVKDEIMSAEAELRYMQGPSATTAPGNSGSGQTIAIAVDDRMNGLLVERNNKQEILDYYRSKYGESSSLVIDMRQSLEITNSAIETRRRQLVEAPQTTVHASMDQAQMRVAQLGTLLAMIDKEMRDVGDRRIAIKGLKNEVTDCTKKLDEVKAAIEQTNFESAGSGRTRVMSTGDIPFKPTNHRPVLAAWTAGAMFVFGTAMGAMLMGRKRRRAIKTA